MSSSRWARWLVAAMWLCAPSAVAQAQNQAATTLDPRAAKARLVLETHCARCHQRDRLQRPSPARDLGDILDLGRIASDPSLIVPGNADASLLYSLMIRKEMPPGAPIEASPGDPPSSAEVEALRDWIEALTPAKPPACPADPARSRAGVLDAAAGAIVTSPATSADLRFVSLAHLGGACASSRARDGYRQAIAKLLNGVSRAAAPMRPAAVDADGWVLSVRLSELGWTAADWDALTAGNPMAVGASSAVAPLVAPAEWLAARAMEPQVYARLLGLAPALDEQLKGLGIDRAKPEAGGRVRRIGIKGSTMTRGPRVIEQIERSSDSVWLVYDFSGSDGTRDLATRPLGPIVAPAEALPFKPDGVRLMFALANGFPAFAAYDADGNRIDAVSIDVAAPAVGASADRRAPAGCVSCHDGGPRKAADTLRETMLAPASTLPKSVRDAVAALHPPPDVTDQMFATEGLRYRAALRAAGIEPELAIYGLEPVTALVRAYHRPVTLARLADEAGTSPAALAGKLEVRGEDAALLLARLQKGQAIPRAEASRLLAPLGTALAAADSAAQLDLTLLPDKSRYVAGETATFTIRSSFDCNLTLISVNAAGKATVVFPNDFEPDNALKAGTALRIPGEASPYRFRLTQPGKERLIAICTTISKMADGIRQDYEKQRFTALGDWRNFLRAIVDDETPDTSSQDKAEARSKGRAPPARIGKKEAEAPKRIRMEPQARAAIDYEVVEKPR